MPTHTHNTCVCWSICTQNTERVEIIKRKAKTKVPEKWVGDGGVWWKTAHYWKLKFFRTHKYRAEHTHRDDLHSSLNNGIAFLKGSKMGRQSHKHITTRTHAQKESCQIIFLHIKWMVLHECESPRRLFLKSIDSIMTASPDVSYTHFAHYCRTSLGYKWKCKFIYDIHQNMSHALAYNFELDSYFLHNFFGTSTDQVNCHYTHIESDLHLRVRCAIHVHMYTWKHMKIERKMNEIA